MADPNFLNRLLNVRIEPAIVLLNCLTVMMKFSTRAVLVVTGRHKFEISAIIPNCAFYVTLDMKSIYICAPSNSDGYSLSFNLQTWIQQLHYPISRQPLSFLYIGKKSGSSDHYCLLENNLQSINLGKAQFVKSRGLHVNNRHYDLRATMRTQQFKPFIENFANIHINTESAVQLHITGSTVRWATPFGDYGHFAEVEGLRAGDSYQFLLRWESPLREMLCSASIGFDIFEVSVYQSLEGTKWYRFCFLMDGQSFSFSYLGEDRTNAMNSLDSQGSTCS